MPLKHGLLGLLNYGDMTGYDLAKTFEDSLSYFWQAQMSQIYRELNTMERASWLVSSIKVQTDKPNKRLYHITNEGRAELKSWLESDITDEIMSPRNRLLIKLFFFSGLNYELGLEKLKNIKEACAGYLKAMNPVEENIEKYGKSVGNSYDMLFWEMTNDFGRAYHQMTADWAKRCIKKMEAYHENSCS